MSKPVELLIDRGKVQSDALDRAERVAMDAHDAVETTLTRLGLVSERDMALAFAEALHLAIAEANELCRELPRIAGVSPLFFRQFSVLPLEHDDRDYPNFCV